MPKVRKIPLRMCVGCQEMRPKKEMIRVVRTPEDGLVIDSTGKKSGRGAYLCPQGECLQKAVKYKRLEKALQRPLSPEVLEQLKQGLKTN
ncbi:MAG: YlxR family protein [Bacillota bacterium]